MKILVVTDLYPVKSDEKFTPKTVFDFVQGWKNLGHEVLVIKPNFILNSFIRKKPFYKTGEYDGIVNLNYWTPFWGNIKTKLNTVIRNFVSDNKFDLVIAHMPSGLIFANKLGYPFTAGVHVSDLEVLTNPVYSIYFKKEQEKAYRNATKIACRSEILKKKFLSLYPEFSSKTFVAYSGIESEIILNRNWENKERYRVLTCANLIKRKNTDKVIKACENLDNIDLNIIGDGQELKNLKRISSKPKFLGYLKHKQVIEEMRKADIFILPSENETFGMVYLEAMASGCVTIGLEGDGIDGIIKDGYNGYLVNLDNINEVLKNILKNDNNIILKNSYETIKNYTKEKACINYLENIAFK